ncbi:MAG: biotin/lipoyl-binding protein [Alphaproteobacteria bacterium]|nr:biotin/lipoyl-binding protein [Alphaproteobacteria bacterium]
MPGAVVRVQVSAGDSVHAGQVLVVVEAMKMENEFKAPFAGVVASVEVAAGQAVESGAVLVVLDPADA